MDNSPNIFQSDGRQYLLTISIIPDYDMMPDDNIVTLDIQGIEEFTYASELNSLVLTGTITYVDKYGLIDKFIEQQNCMCDVMLAEMIVETDGDISNGMPDPDNSFMHRFIVNGFKIVDRQQTVVKYSIGLVSRNWYKCIANQKFSNYDDSDDNPKPRNVFKILNACMTDVNLATDDTLSDDKVQTDVKIDYSTQTNDNLFDVFSYLMDKLYFWEKKDNAFKFLVYNWYKDNYGLIDISDMKTFMGTAVAVLSFFGTNAENLVQSIESNIGSYSNGMRNTDLYMSMFKKNVYYYSLNKNEFISADYSIEQKSLVDYMNKHDDADDHVKKYHELSLPETLKYNQSCTYWNLPVNVYFNILDSIYSTGALTLNKPGEIRCQCGYCIAVTVDRDMAAARNDSTEEMERLKTKYTGFEGYWLALKVVSVICPSKNMFRQKIALFRNHTMYRKSVEIVKTV